MTRHRSDKFIMQETHNRERGEQGHLNITDMESGAKEEQAFPVNRSHPS